MFKIKNQKLQLKLYCRIFKQYVYRVVPRSSVGIKTRGINLNRTKYSEIFKKPITPSPIRINGGYICTLLVKIYNFALKKI